MNYIKEFKLFSFEKYDLITEDTEFFQYQFNGGGATPNPLGPGYGFAADPSVSIYTHADSPYTDLYSRTKGFVNDLKGVIDHIQKGDKSIAVQKFDHFVDDIENYDNLRILRMFENDSNYLDIYISFEFNEEEYFGVYRNFNRPYNRSKLDTELFENSQYGYINEQYKLKLSNYFRKILNNWFIPKKGKWKNLKEGYLVKDDMGTQIYLKKNIIIDVDGYNVDENNNPYIIIDWKGNKYKIKDNNFYWFNWFCEKLDIK